MVPYQQLYKSMHNEEIVLTYKGEMTNDLVNSLLCNFEPRLKCMERNLQTRKKLYNILLECLQNIVYHQDMDKYFRCDSQVTLLLITSENHRYAVRTGNMILNDKVHELKGWLDVINSLSQDELKNSYKKILDRGQFSSKGTAGLGFIDIARKSGEKLSYAFQKVNEKYSIFSFYITVPKAVTMTVND